MLVSQAFCFVLFTVTGLGMGRTTGARSVLGRGALTLEPAADSGFRAAVDVVGLGTDLLEVQVAGRRTQSSLGALRIKPVLYESGVTNPRQLATVDVVATVADQVWAGWLLDRSGWTSVCLDGLLRAFFLAGNTGWCGLAAVVAKTTTSGADTWTHALTGRAFKVTVVRASRDFVILWEADRGRYASAVRLTGAFAEDLAFATNLWTVQIAFGGGLLGEAKAAGITAKGVQVLGTGLLVRST